MLAGVLSVQPSSTWQRSDQTSAWAEHADAVYFAGSWTLWAGTPEWQLIRPKHQSWCSPSSAAPSCGTGTGSHTLLYPRECSASGRRQCASPLTPLTTSASISRSRRPRSAACRHPHTLHEAHISSFTPDGTFASAISKLDHLASLGVHILQPKPVHTDAWTDGQGYMPVHLFARKAEGLCRGARSAWFAAAQFEPLRESPDNHILRGEAGC